MFRRVMRVHCLSLCLLLPVLTACGDDPGPKKTGSDGYPSTGDGDGDGDGDDDAVGDGDTSHHGDGDGEFGTGDGDGGEPGSSTPDASTPSSLPKGEDYSGWTWVETKGSKCRDGSPAGYYYRLGKSKDLMIFLNGGGACADHFFCGLNPVNVSQDMPLEYLIQGTGNLVFGPSPWRQLPVEEGVFKRDPRNPVGDWNMIFVPYCTGDIHAGVNTDVTVKDVPGVQQFVGYTNFGLFLESFGPSFASAKTILLTGSSAGGFGTLLNFDRTQEFFKPYGGKVIGITDSGIPMRDEYMAACLQKRWRELWGLDKVLPKDCKDCFHEDGGGLTQALADYYFHTKYKGRMLGGAISTKQDEIIRAFFAPGLNATKGKPDNCTVDPGYSTVFSALYLDEVYPGSKFTEGLKDAAQTFGEDQLGYYGMEGSPHMHLFRPDYYNKNGLDKTIAEWVADILAEKNTKVGTFD
ncbi:MAG: pectin acetylesterase-family hydrolase [Myxococcales bacterium]